MVEVLDGFQTHAFALAVAQAWVAQDFALWGFSLYSAALWVDAESGGVHCDVDFAESEVRSSSCDSGGAARCVEDCSFATWPFCFARVKFVEMAIPMRQVRRCFVAGGR